TYANHALDACLYARVAAELARVWDQPSEAEWTARETALRISAPPPPTPTATPGKAPAAPTEPTAPRSRSPGPPVLSRTTAPPSVSWRRSTYGANWPRWH